MSLSSKKHWKLQEFVAHGANVNCLAFGRKSGHVMVTGGDDKKVNLWAVGKPNCIMSLSGHTTSVECVRFDPREIMVCAGSMSGALKVWDLEAVKIIRTLTGHKASIRCLDFHPYGDYIASGSLDTNIKLWDARKKGCIYTYKGHNKAVNALKFSPDGKWVASGAEDGSVKLWDLSAGKLLTEFQGHSASVSGVEFHPKEFLLASGSSDRTVKFWDLESFQLVSSTGGDGGPVRCIYFHSSGTCMFSGSQDILKVYGWEPAGTHDTLLANWGRVFDMTITHNQLTAGSFQMNSVAVHVVQVDTLQPFNVMDNSNVTYIPNQCLTSGMHIRKNFDTDYFNDKINPIDLKISDGINQDYDVENDNFGFEDLDDVVDSDEAFIPKSELCRTPPKSDPFPIPSDDPASLKSDFLIKSLEETKSTSVHKMTSTYSVTEIPEKLSRSTASSPIKCAPQARAPYVSSAPLTSSSISVRSIPYSTSFGSTFTQKPLLADDGSLKQKPCERATAIRRAAGYPHPPEAVSIVRPTTFVSDKETFVQRVMVYPEQLKSKGLTTDFVPDQRDKPAGLDVDDFLPKTMQQCLGITQTLQPEVSEAEAMTMICREHQPLLSVFGHRVKKLQIVLALLKSKDHKIAVETAVSMNDPAIIVDILSLLNRRADMWSLDLCQMLLPSIQDLVQSKYEVYMLAGCSALRLMLKKFGSVIKSNIEAPPSIGVDLCGEERANKCRNCYEQLLAIQSFILKRQTMQGKLGQSFRELLSMMCSEFTKM